MKLCKIPWYLLLVSRLPKKGVFHSRLINKLIEDRGENISLSLQVIPSNWSCFWHWLIYPGHQILRAWISDNGNNVKAASAFNFAWACKKLVFSSYRCYFPTTWSRISVNLNHMWSCLHSQCTDAVRNKVHVVQENGQDSYQKLFYTQSDAKKVQIIPVGGSKCMNIYCARSWHKNRFLPGWNEEPINHNVKRPTENLS